MENIKADLPLPDGPIIKFIFPAVKTVDRLFRQWLLADT